MCDQYPIVLEHRHPNPLVHTHTHTHITESVRMSASPCVRQGVPHEAWERRVLFIFDLFIHIFYSYLICFILTEVYSYLILI